MTELTLPEGIESIGYEAFNCSRDLTEITIPAGASSIGEKAFGYYFDDETKDYVKVDGFKISCYRNTAGEQYAKDNGFEYEFLDPALPGDANRDGKQNMKDLVLVQRHLNGWAVDIDLTVCDLTGDSKVNMKDYVALQRKLNGWT